MPERCAPVTGLPASGLAAIRNANVVNVVRSLRRNGPTIRSDLPELVGLARPTITAVVTQLLHDGVLVETGSRSSGARGGRPGRLLGFNPSHLCVAFSRVRPGRIEAQLADLDGRMLVGEVRKIDGSPEYLFGQLAELIQVLVGRAGAGPLGGLSVVLAGDIDEQAGTCDFPPVGWDHVPVASLLRADFDVPIRLISPPRAAAITCIADGLCPDGRGLVVFFDVGVAVCVVEDWRAIAPSSGGGELGHCVIPGSTRPCPCGRVGCLGQTASGWAIARELTERGAEQHAAATLRELGELGDPVVDAVLGEAAEALGTGLSWLLNITGSRPVIVGGTPYAAGAEGFLDSLGRVIQRHVPPPLAAQVRVCGCSPDATTAGAVHAALELLPAHLRPLQHSSPI